MSNTSLTNQVLASDLFEISLQGRHPANPKLLALAGNAVGVVQIPDRPGFIYVRISGDASRCTAARCLITPPPANTAVYIQKQRPGQASPYEVIATAGSAYASTILLDQGIGPGSDVQSAIEYLNAQLETVLTYIGAWGMDGWGSAPWGGK